MQFVGVPGFVHSINSRRGARYCSVSDLLVQSESTLRRTHQPRNFAGVPSPPPAGPAQGKRGMNLKGK